MTVKQKLLKNKLRNTKTQESKIQWMRLITNKTQLKRECTTWNMGQKSMKKTEKGEMDEMWGADKQVYPAETQKQPEKEQRSKI